MGGVQSTGNRPLAQVISAPLIPHIRELFYSLLLFAAFALAACGGDAASTPTPTRTVTNVPSATGTSSDSGSFSEEKKVFVGAGRFEEVSLTLRQGDVLKIDYNAEVRISPGFGGTAAQERTISLAVLDPDGSKLVEVTNKSSGSLELNIESGGDHTIILLNPFPLEALNVTLKYSVNM